MPPEQMGGGGAMDLDSLIQLLSMILTTPPDQPAGELAGGGKPFGPPAFADTPDPMGAQLMQMLQMLQMAQSQSPQQGMNAAAGQAGGMYGMMGGRPIGS